MSTDKTAANKHGKKISLQEAREIAMDMGRKADSRLAEQRDRESLENRCAECPEKDERIRSLEADNKRMREELEMKECPWPEDIFTPFTREEENEIVEVISMVDVVNSTDRISAWLMRKAWRSIKQKHAEVLSQVSEYPSPLL